MKRQPKNENETNLMDKLVTVRRVAAVAKGGRRFSFSALVVVGDGKGRVGFATGKAREVPDAVKKATERAKKKMVRISLRDGRTLQHDITASRGASLIRMRPAPSGTGIIAGGAMRKVFEAVGLQDVVSKSLGSSNQNNLIRVTIEGLKSMKSPRQIALNRNRKIAEIINNRDGVVKEINNE